MARRRNNQTLQVLGGVVFAAMLLAGGTWAWWTYRKQRQVPPPPTQTTAEVLGLILPKASGLQPKLKNIQGKVMDRKGGPIQIPGAEINVQISGRSTWDNKTIQFAPRVNGEGVFSQDVPDEHLYQVICLVDVPWNDVKYSFRLHPLDGRIDNAEFDAAKGLVRDFVLLVNGRKSLDLSPLLDTSYYGGKVVGVWDRFTRNPTPFPEGTQVVVKLSPTKPLINGFPGEVVLRTVNKDDRTFRLLDVPIGSYTAHIEATPPGGKATEVMIVTGGEPGQWELGSSVNVEFKPYNRYSGATEADALRLADDMKAKPTGKP